MIHIALDAMGGDHTPLEPIRGALLAVKELPIHIDLVGNETIIKPLLMKENKGPHKKITIHHAPENIEMAESPSKAFRQKKNSSIHIGLTLIKDKKATAFVSAGNTGAVLTASTFILGRINHVERPALAGILPSSKHPFIMLDLGANVDSKPSQLLQYAIMGSCFSEFVLHQKHPKVGLLNIGEEKDKGNSCTLSSYEFLENAPINFIGNVEAKTLPFGDVDVVVCDGFVGNNMLKFGEGLFSLFSTFFKSHAKKSPIAKLGFLLLRSTFKKFKEKFDYDEYGGAFLLGVNGVSIIAHGHANETAFKNAIKTAYLAVENNITNKISDGINKIASSTPKPNSTTTAK